MFKNFKQCGQVVVLYAVVIPFLFMALGAGLDLGWYYLNVSRLQNAADAAAVAGAHAIIKNNQDILSGYEIKLTEKFSADNDNDPDVSMPGTFEGDAVAATYALKNLSSESTYSTETDDEGKRHYTMTGNWGRDDAPKIIMTPTIHKSDENYYYVVHLKEKIAHLFMPGWFDPMDAPVVAVAKITKNPADENSGINLIDIEKMATGNKENLTEEDKKKIKVYYNHELAVNGYEYTPQGSALQDYMLAAKNRTSEYKISDHEITPDANKIAYTEGNTYRTETNNVYGNGYTQSKGSRTSPLDYIFLDFKPDINYSFTEDWDIGQTTDNITPEKVTYRNQVGMASGKTDSWKSQYNLRIISSINFETPYLGRDKSTTEKNIVNDVMWVRIESETIKSLDYIPEKKGHKAYNSVRQIVLNMNKSNFDGSNSKYKNQKYRPLIIFYDGPEKIDENSTVRDSKPVVLNLNTDYRCILFAINSPVIINGNGHKLRGFVVAKEFLRFKTKDDFVAEGYVRLKDSYDNYAYFKLSDAVDNINAADAENYIAITVDNKTKYIDKSASEYMEVTPSGSSNVMIVDKNGDLQTMPLNLGNVTRDLDSNKKEVPVENLVTDSAYEKVYKMHTAFNIDTSDDSKTTSYYDSYEEPTLVRNVYKYLDYYLPKYTNKTDYPNAVDMFFTAKRAEWIK